MWIAQIIIPLLMMVIGFMLGIMAEGEYGRNRELDKLSRKVRRLERRMEAEE